MLSPMDRLLLTWLISSAAQLLSHWPVTQDTQMGRTHEQRVHTTTLWTSAVFSTAVSTMGSSSLGTAGFAMALLKGSPAH
jgi:hypothetical protein